MCSCSGATTRAAVARRTAGARRCAPAAPSPRRRLSPPDPSGAAPVRHADPLPPAAEARIAQLEREVAELRTELAALRDELGA